MIYSLFRFKACYSTQCERMNNFLYCTYPLFIFTVASYIAVKSVKDKTEESEIRKLHELSLMMKDLTCVPNGKFILNVIFSPLFLLKCIGNYN